MASSAAIEADSESESGRPKPCGPCGGKKLKSTLKNVWRGHRAARRVVGSSVGGRKYLLPTDLPVIMIDSLYCRSTAVLLAMHVWLYVVGVLYMVSDAGRPRGVVVADSWITHLGPRPERALQGRRGVLPGGAGAKPKDLPYAPHSR